jgi:hypothetical protein
MLMKFLFVLWMSCLAIQSAQAAPDEHPIVLAGTEFSSSNAYSYTGSVIPLEGSSLKQGFNMPVFVSLLNYSYTTTQNQQLVTVRAQVPGIRAGLGYQWLDGDAALGLSGSVGYQNTYQTPYIPATGKQGSALFFLPQVQAKYQFTPLFDADLMANYLVGQSSYWSHLRLGYQPRWDWHIGPEFGLQAGPDYRIQKVGAFMATQVFGGAMFELNGGAQSNINLPNQAYLGLALSKSL